MKTFKRLLVWSGLTFLLLAAAFVGYSQYIIGSGPDRVPYPLQLPTDAQSLAEGERLAKMVGCPGCHTDTLGGVVFFDEPVFARLIAPNLTTAVRRESVENVEAALRQGIGFDGRPLVVMPSEAFSYLTDEDTAKIIAYLRSLPEVHNDLPETYFGPRARFLFVLGKLKTEPRRIRDKPALQFDPVSQPRLAHGEYLAMTMCAECHGTDFNGVDEGGFATPSLNIVAAYSPDQFTHLLTTGEGIGGRDLGLMSAVAVSRTVHLRDEEVQALYAFLTDRLERAAAN